MTAISETPKPVLIGRSSSHFTRVARIFAAECGVEYSFQVVRDLMSTELDTYGGNPALKMPVLQTADGTWFGALNISRELVRRSGSSPRIVWPEQSEAALLANAQELALHSMATEVILIMSGNANTGDGDPVLAKVQKSLLNTLAWLDKNMPDILAALPVERDLSFLEVTLYCLITHLAFRSVVPVDGYLALQAFAEEFSVRPSIAMTEFHFDP